MTVPRRLVPGQTHAVTRRTEKRRKLLIPRAGVRELQGYALGRALELSGRPDLHAFMSSTTHYHANLTDRPPDGDASTLPQFLRSFNGLFARAMNARLGLGGAFWCSGSYDNVEIHGQLSLEQQLVYTWLNPVQDGFCERPEDWPGLKFLPEDWGTTFEFPRPEGAFFGGARPARVEPQDPDARADWQAALREEELAALELGRDRDRARDPTRGRTPRRQKQHEAQRRRRRDGRDWRKQKVAAPKPLRKPRTSLPEVVRITPVPPPGYEHLTLDEVKAHFRRLLDEGLEVVLARRRQERRTRFMGVAAILAEDPREPAGDSFPSFARNPRIACRDRETRLGLLRGLELWRADVKRKREQWRDGDREVVFPRGVYGMWALHGARVDGLSAYAARAAPPGAAA